MPYNIQQNLMVIGRVIGLSFANSLSSKGKILKINKYV